MLIKAQFDPASVNTSAEAFAATITQFKVSIPQLSMASGLSKDKIQRFYDIGAEREAKLKGTCDELTSTDLFKLIMALTPNERTFYYSMLAIQDAALDAGISLPLLDLQRAKAEGDPIRSALRMTMTVFGIQFKHICEGSGEASGNLSNWFNGKNQNITVKRLDRIKNALSREQRAFYNSVINALVAIELDFPKEVETRQLFTQLETQLKAA